VTVRRTFSGTLEPTAHFIVGSKVAGRINAMSVDLADPVRRGQVVADWAEGDDERVVSMRHADEGDTVSANAPLLTIVELPTLSVEVNYDGASRDALDFKVDTTSKPQTGAPAIDDVDERVALALRVRTDLNEARLRAQQQRLEVVVTRNGMLPQLDLFVDLGISGFSNRFGDTFREVDDGDNYDITAGVRFSQVLGNRAAEARDLAARASRQQALEAIANLEQIVRLEIRLAINEVERARQQIAASAATRQSQEATVLAERERFNVGASTALLVAQAQRDLLLASIVEVEALVHYRIALVNLYLVEGSLLERRGVSISPRRSVQ